MDEKVRQALAASGAAYEERCFDVPFETTAQAAEMLGTDREHIAKTMVFQAGDGAITIIAAGDARVDNRKFKTRFSLHPTMLRAEELLTLTGFEPGSVSPIGVAARENPVYMDVSLKRYRGELVYPSGGTDRCAVAITPEELYRAAQCSGTVDVCKERAL